MLVLDRGRRFIRKNSAMRRTSSLSRRDSMAIGWSVACIHDSCHLIFPLRGLHMRMRDLKGESFCMHWGKMSNVLTSW